MPYTTKTEIRSVSTGILDHYLYECNTCGFQVKTSKEIVPPTMKLHLKFDCKGKNEKLKG